MYLKNKLTQLCFYAKGIEPLVRALHARGVAVFLISGGFRELTLPIASYLGINRENVFANRMNWQVGVAAGGGGGVFPLT